MKTKLLESINIPSGIECSLHNGILKSKKSNHELSRFVGFPGIETKIEAGKLIFKADRGSKKEFKQIKSLIAHVKNIFGGLDKKFIYKLQSANVHFPMTLKVEKHQLIINNFLGEKTPRKAKILPNVEVEVKGQNITIESNDKEAAGQTAANFEKATKVRNRDRRIFQDGIYIVEKGAIR